MGILRGLTTARVPKQCHSEQSEVFSAIERFLLDEAWLDFGAVENEGSNTSSWES